MMVQQLIPAGLQHTAAALQSLSGVLEVLPADDRVAFDRQIALTVRDLASGLNPAALDAAGWQGPRR